MERSFFTTFIKNIKKIAGFGDTGTIKSVVVPPDTGLLPRDHKSHLLQETQKYVNGKRFATGLRFLLACLDKYPSDHYILEMAAILIHSGMSYGNIYDAARNIEQLTEDLICDSRLDSIFNECAKCGNCWVSVDHYLPYKSVSKLNPVGGQCSGCGKVFCANCLKSLQLGIEVSFPACPECSGQLRPIKKVTGRHSRQAQRINLPIEFIFFLRKGLITPDGEYIVEVLKKMCPDVLEGHESPRISAMSIENWNNIADLSMALLMRDNPGYFSENYMLAPVYGTYDGDSVHIIRVYRKKYVKPGMLSIEVDEDEIKRISNDNEYNREILEKAENCRDGEGLFELACKLHLAGNFSAAARYMVRSSEYKLDKPMPAALVKRMDVTGQRFEKARAIIERSMAIQKNGSTGQAIELMATAKSITPNWAVLFSSLGWMYILNNNMVEAENCLRRALEIDPYLPEAHNNLGMFFLYKRQREKARECFNYAITLKPDFPEARENLDTLEEVFSNPEKLSTRTGEQGILFWFNWKEISQRGHSFYGAYIYNYLMPYFSHPGRNKRLGSYFFFDGDFLGEKAVDPIYQGPEEAACLKEVIRIGRDVCYIVAIYGNGPIDFSTIHEQLKNSDINGYIGMTSCPGFGFNQFYELAVSMALVPAFTLHGNRLEKESFDFISEDKLNDLGFEVVARDNR
jgi:tetratricopeptide (TPR) repeat protein